MKFVNRFKKYICNRKLIPYIIVLTILLLSVGYSAFSSNLSIRDLYAEVRLQKDVRITGISVAPETGTTFNPYAYGTEYQIDPGDGITRTFYVLEDGDNTSLIKGDTGTTGVGEVSLIMNENIGDKTWWGIAGAGAPTIALPYLKEQTTGWSNVEVNMPTYEQIYSVNNSTDLTATPWLNDFSYNENGIPECYWTEKFLASDPEGDIGYCVEQELSFGRSYCFVRPVITLKKSDLLGTVVIQNNGGTTTYLDYNVKNIQTGINLPNENSSVTFNVVVTNIGNAEVGIKEITGLPDNLDYEILNYNLENKVCDENNVCKLGIQKEILIKIKYKEGYYDSNNTQYNIVANFDFQPFYTINYIAIDGEGYPTEILGGDTLTVDFGDNAPENISIKTNNVETNNYTYENGILTLPNVDGNVTIEKSIPKLCTLLNGESNKIGSKYSCDFGDGKRNFYILELGTNPVTNSTLKEDEVALILEGNYDTTTQTWCASAYNNSCNADGLTSKLDDIAEAWKELEREQIVLPSALQIIVANDPSKNAIESTYPIQSWLYNWPDNANYGRSAPYGYWTSTPNAEDSNFAWYVEFDGHVSNYLVAIGDDYGVRPVVNLKI